MKAVIIAGGKGTRISSLFNDIPKPLIPIEGMPILEREIACLKEQGIKDIIITVGDVGQQIIDYFGDGSKLLLDLNKVEEIVKAVAANSEVPVTLKYRKGWDSNNIVACKVAKIAEKNGISAIR